MSKADAEFNWWLDFHRSNKDSFRNIREKDWYDRSKNLLGIKWEKGVGLDYGCGLLSMLEFSELRFDAIDPLMDKYRTILELGDNYHVNTNKKYDWILCCNVLDHDEHPERIIEDIKNKLKPDGTLYLEVNFDDHLGGCHYELYNKERVRELLKDFKIDFELEDRIEKDKQTAYYARCKMLDNNSMLESGALVA